MDGRRDAGGGGHAGLYGGVDEAGVQEAGRVPKELKTTLEEATLRASYAIYIECKTPGWCLDAWRVWRPVRKAAAEGGPK